MPLPKLKRARSCTALDPHSSTIMSLKNSILSLDKLGRATAGKSQRAVVSPDDFEHVYPMNPHTPPPPPTLEQARGSLDVCERYAYELARAQLRSSTHNSAMLAGFAMTALVELQYETNTPHEQFIIMGVVVTLNVSVHILALLISTCILPHMTATRCTRDSPHVRLKFFIDLCWFFSTCLGLLLFLVQVGVIFFVKFHAVNYNAAAYVTTAMIVPVLVAFVVISIWIHQIRVTHTISRFHEKVDSFKHYFEDESFSKMAPRKVMT